MSTGSGFNMRAKLTYFVCISVHTLKLKRFSGWREVGSMMRSITAELWWTTKADPLG